jgi:NlpC/P60 family
MRSRANLAVLLLSCLLATATSLAQKQVQETVEPGDGNLSTSRAEMIPPRRSSRPALMNVNDALSVIGAALESRDRDRAKSDCSHLVHSIYENAGFHYTYASSSTLYGGIAEFQPVTRPQVGDLVVWPGHVGIVVNPTQQTFFSALRSGRGVESYSSAYWSARGRHRFFRYVKATNTTRAADSRASGPSESLTRVTHESPVNEETESKPEAIPPNIGPARVQIISSGRPKPKEVTQALLLTFNTSQEGLGDADVFELNPSLIVFSQLEVKTVKIHGEQGQAVVRITAPVSVAKGKADLKKRQQTQIWRLRRLGRWDWELLLPQDAIYLPQNDAVRVLSHRLAALTDPASTSTQREKSELALMLKTLLTE